MPGKNTKDNKEEKFPILCPLVKVPNVPLCDPSELDELVSYLDQRVAPLSDIRFERGNLSADGRLDLCKQGVGISGTQKLVDSLEKNPFVKHILLGTDSLGDEGAKVLASHIDENSSLETVYLGCNLITEQGTAALSNAIKSNSQVKSLWLKRNPVGDEGAAALSGMLANNESLRTLDLVNTNIGTKGLASIAGALENGGSSLQALYLGGNQLDASCSDSLVKILQVPSLKALFLNVNNLGDEFLDALIANGPYGNKVITLGLGSNGISAVGLKKLLTASKNISFRSLDLGYSRSTKVLGAEANFFGDTLGEYWSEWISDQRQLEELILNKTGVGQNCLCSVLDQIKNHPTLHTLRLSRLRNASLRDRLRQVLDSNKCDQILFNDYRDDVRKIKSVYR